MKLAAYLTSNGISRTDFAQRIGVSSGAITAYCDGRSWISRKIAERIIAETGGEVTPNDFLGISDDDAATCRAGAAP